jgi:DNA-binding Lrp family transcriptional regulator
MDALRAIPEIEECHSVAGEQSMIVKVRVASTSALLELSERLRQIPGVEQTETTIVLKTQIDRPIQSSASGNSGIDGPVEFTSLRLD